MDVRSDIFPDTPDGFHPRDVSVRLARPDERIRWDRLMDQHHYLGFKRFAGHGVRYVFDWRGQWVGLAGWQSGAFKCRPRDQWIGWKRELQFTRMHLISNNTRFLILGAPGCFPNLASLALAAMVQRLSADWSAAYGHSLLLAETFVDPSKFCGHMYKEAGWTRLGQTKGYARANGRYTDPHGVPKDLHVFPLHRDTRSRMCAPDPLPDPLLPNPMGDTSGQPLHGLSTVYEELLRVPVDRTPENLLRFEVKKIKNELVIVATNIPAPKSALRLYRKRWGVECLFADAKTKGFNIEDTHMIDPSKLTTLFIMLTLSMTWSYRCSSQEMGRGSIRKKKHGRFEKSWFRTGLDALRNWILHDPEEALSAWRRYCPKRSISNRCIIGILQ